MLENFSYIYLVIIVSILIVFAVFFVNEKTFKYLFTPTIAQFILSNLYFIIMIFVIFILGLALMSRDSKIQYLFYPKFKIASLATILIFVTLVYIMTLYYAYVQSNWESKKCDEGLHYFAPLFGHNSKTTFKECNNKKINEIVDNRLSGLSQISSYNKEKIKNLKKDSNNLVEDLGSSKSSIENNRKELQNVSQPQMKTLSNTLDKVLGSIFLNTKINKGVLNSVQTLEDSSIGNIVKKFNSVDTNAFDGKLKI